MVRILDCDSFSDECDFLINSLNIEIVCYGMYDEKYKSKPFVIYSFLASNIVKAKEDVCFSIKKDSYYAYELNAKIVDLSTKKVALGDIYIFLDAEFPGDLKLGDYVHFDVLRLDISFI